MNSNIKSFYYVEFESFVDSGHRIHTANSYSEKLRFEALFDKCILISPKSKNVLSDVEDVLEAYDVIDFSLEEILTPEAETTNIHNVAISLVNAIHSHCSNSGYGSVVYTHMPSPFALLALYISMRLLADNHKCQPNVIVRLCMIDEEWEWYSLRLSKIISNISADPIIGHQFKFTSESKGLSKYYQERCNINVPMQLNPFQSNQLVISENKHRYHKFLYGDCLQLAYIGEAREEKGFQYLPKIVDALRNSGFEFKFKIHTFSNVLNDTQSIRAAREALILKSNCSKDLDLLFYPVPSSIYAAHQNRADVIVMPYIQKAYRIRGSGVAFEAIRGNSFIFASEGLDLCTTFEDSEMIVEFNPENVESHNIKELFERVRNRRNENMRYQHPAKLYFSNFFESLFDELTIDKFTKNKAILNQDRFYELFTILEQSLPLSKLTQRLESSNFNFC